jgi:hypothetical protein
VRLSFIDIAVIGLDELHLLAGWSRENRSNLLGPRPSSALTGEFGFKT